MTSQFPRTFGPDVEIVEIDLDVEEVYFHGERLTEARAEQIADAVLAERRRSDPGSACPCTARR